MAICRVKVDGGWPRSPDPAVPIPCLLRKKWLLALRSMIFRTVMISAAACLASHAAVRSGKAEVDWISASATYEAGKPFQTAVRLVVDKGWHTYWKNPGEGGMEISVKWQLPAGWTAGELEQPVPKRFMTGDLPGFGYEGTVIFPVKFTPPAGFTGQATLKGTISWLTCNDEHCVPGDLELAISTNAGSTGSTPETNTITEALSKIPRPLPEAKLTVIDKPETLLLSLKNSGDNPFDINDFEVFPETRQVVDTAATYSFVKEGDHWQAEVKKSEYLTPPLKGLTLVLVSKSGRPPLAVSWKSE
jgi:DsbC/DsbD-like thiol-disulfide interchange protein